MSKVTETHTVRDGKIEYKIDLTVPSTDADFLKFLQENPAALKNAFSDAISNWKYRRAAAVAKSKATELDWHVDILRERSIKDAEPTKADQMQASAMRRAWLDRYNSASDEQQDAVMKEICGKFYAFCRTGNLEGPTWSPAMQASEIAEWCRKVRLAKLKMASDVSAYL